MFYQLGTLLFSTPRSIPMLQVSVMHLPMLGLLILGLPALALLLVGGGSAFLLTYGLTFVVGKLSRKLGWLDRSSAERVRLHKVEVPRLGGVAIYLAFVLASLVFYISDTELQPKEVVIYWLFLAGATLLVAVHVYDDVKGLKPLTKLITQTVAVIIVIGPFIDGMFHGVLLFGFNNPFGLLFHITKISWFNQPVLTLFIHEPVISLAAIPAVIFTWFWMVGMMNTVNFIDGLDGLATGVVAITGLFITVISWTLEQHTIAILAGIFSGAVLGFLPHNWNPARIFMGDSGSQFLGLGLAVLSIMGGAKVALALMLLGIPILDVAIVMINRVRHGQSFAHYDTKHLHHRLLATGLSVRQICYVFYAFTIVFGALALLLPRIYKLIGIGLVCLTMLVLIIWLDYRQRQRGARVGLDDPHPESPTNTPAPLPSRTGERMHKTSSTYEPERA